MTARWCKSAELPIDPALSRNSMPPALVGGHGRAPKAIRHGLTHATFSLSYALI